MLAGGGNRRLGGRPKGLELVGGRRIIDRVVEALSPHVSQLILAANDANADDWLPDVAILPDELSGTGGLAGVHAALGLGHDAIVVAWDMPFVNGDVVTALLRRARETSARAVVPESESPTGLEPFCAWYAPDVRDALGAFLRRGGAAAEFLGSLSGVERLRLADVRVLGDPRRLFFSVNTPEDLARANTMAGSAH